MASSPDRMAILVYNSDILTGRLVGRGAGF